jgi:hypothetical protein
VAASATEGTAPALIQLNRWSGGAQLPWLYTGLLPHMPSRA